MCANLLCEIEKFELEAVDVAILRTVFGFQFKTAINISYRRK